MDQEESDDSPIDRSMVGSSSQPRDGNQHDATGDSSSASIHETGEGIAQPKRPHGIRSTSDGILKSPTYRFRDLSGDVSSGMNPSTSGPVITSSSTLISSISSHHHHLRPGISRAASASPGLGVGSGYGMGTSSSATTPAPLSTAQGDINNLYPKRIPLHSQSSQSSQFSNISYAASTGSSNSSSFSQNASRGHAHSLSFSGLYPSTHSQYSAGIAEGIEQRAGSPAVGLPAGSGGAAERSGIVSPPPPPIGFNTEAAFPEGHGVDLRGLSESGSVGRNRSRSRARSLEQDGEDVAVKEQEGNSRRFEGRLEGRLERRRSGSPSLMRDLIEIVSTSVSAPPTAPSSTHASASPSTPMQMTSSQAVSGPSSNDNVQQRHPQQVTEDVSSPGRVLDQARERFLDYVANERKFSDGEAASVDAGTDQHLKVPEQRPVVDTSHIVSPATLLNISSLESLEGEGVVAESPTTFDDSVFVRQQSEVSSVVTEDSGSGADREALSSPQSSSVATLNRSSSLSLGKNVSPSGSTGGSSASIGSTGQSSVLGRWAAARDRRTSPPMAGPTLPLHSVQSSRSGSSSTSSGRQPSVGTDTAHLWDSVWPGKPPPRAPLVRSTSEADNSAPSSPVPVGSHAQLIHHPHTYPLAQSSSPVLAALTNALPGSPLLVPATQSQSSSRHGLLASAISSTSPTLAPVSEAPSPSNTARRESFSSPEGWQMRLGMMRSPQTSGSAPCRRGTSPPGSPLVSPAQGGTGQVLAARRSIGASSDGSRSSISTLSNEQSSESRRSSAGTSGQSNDRALGSIGERMTFINEGSRISSGPEISPETVVRRTDDEHHARPPATIEASIEPTASSPDKHDSPPFELPPSQLSAPAAPRNESPKSPSAKLELDLPSSVPAPPDVLEVTNPSPSSIVVEGPSPKSEIPVPDSNDRSEVYGTGQRLPVTEFDEVMAVPKDLLPTDVAFEDEGLNTLERIFLLSKSEYPFHRAYVARMLGDLLTDVDPCETVEYVLPLLSGFAVDEDEMVKEAFAGEIHRIIWFFFSSCDISDEDDTVIEDSPSPPAPCHVTTITSEGVSTVVRPADSTPAPSEAAVMLPESSRPLSATMRSSVASSIASVPQSTSTVSTVGSGSTFGSTPGSSADTPNSTVSGHSNSIDGVSYSPKAYEATPGVDETGEAKERPCIPVHVFTPLLGSMLLSQNSSVADPTRAAIVAIIAKLRGVEHHIVGSWQDTRPAGERRTYVSQTGLHTHEVSRFSTAAKEAIENELLEGLVLGMGKLDAGSTESGLQRTSSNVEDHQEIEGMSAEEATAFRAQLSEEAVFGRAISMNLIASVAEFYPADAVQQLGFVDTVLAARDDEPGVKTEAALALAYLAKVAPMEHVPDMVSLFEHFSADENEQVRQSACLCLPALVKRLDTPEQRREFAVTSLRSLMDSTLAVQYTALEILGEVIHIFNTDPQGPPSELLEYYLATHPVGEELPPKPDMIAPVEIEEREPAKVDFEDLDRAVVAAFNFPSVCLTLGPARWSELREVYMALQRINHPRIKRSLAASLHELALILGPAITATDLLPFFYQYLEDTPEIREKAMANLPVFVANLHGSGGTSTDLREVKEAVELVEVLSKLWSDGFFSNWHEREVLAGQTSRLLEVFVSTASDSLQDTRAPLRIADEASAEDAANGSLELLRSGLVDTFAAVRDAAVANIPHCFEVVRNVETLRTRLFSLLQELAANYSFKMRKCYIACIQALLDSPWSTTLSPSLTNDHAEQRRSFFEEYFLEPLSIMCDDLVDVRIALSKLVGKLCMKDAVYAHAQTRPPRLSRMISTLSSDDSDYVRNPLRFISQTPPVVVRTSSFRSAAVQSEGTSVVDEIFSVIRNADGRSGRRVRKVRSEAAGMGMSRTDSDSTIRPISTPSDGSLLSPGTPSRPDDRGSRSAPAYVGQTAMRSLTGSAGDSPATKSESKGGPKMEPSQVGMTDVFEQSFQDALTDRRS